MLTQVLLAGLPLALVGATIVTVRSLSRLVLAIAWAVAAALGARVAAELFRAMLAARRRRGGLACSNL